ncbi:MAG: hypothetical protein M1829_001699 [Trizodia sp. TS-e1964]|nr:MAG: hypothetical protein M1829_001699 [Trizodia sp. TS-e1964]
MSDVPPTPEGQRAQCLSTAKFCFGREDVDIVTCCGVEDNEDYIALVVAGGKVLLRGPESISRPKAIERLLWNLESQVTEKIEAA